MYQSRAVYIWHSILNVVLQVGQIGEVAAEYILCFTFLFEMFLYLITNRALFYKRFISWKRFSLDNPLENVDM